MSSNQHVKLWYFDEITKHLNPAWFASVMGTAVIPLALSFTAWPIKLPLVSFFLVLSIFMFVVTLIPWTLKFFFYPENVKKDFEHPVAASFFPTMPISLVIFALDFLKYPTLFFSEDTSYTLAF